MHDFIKYKKIPLQKYKEARNKVKRQKTDPMSQNIVKSVSFSIKKVVDQNLNTTNENRLSKNKYHIHQSFKYLAKRKNQTQLNETINKLQRIQSCVYDLSKGLKISKRQFLILNKFNIVTKTYQKKIPKNFQQNSRRSLQNNQKLQEMCFEEDKQKQKEKQRKQKFKKMMKYQQPLQFKFRRISKKNKSTIDLER